MKPLIVANWKMNPETEAEAAELFGAAMTAAKAARNVSVVVAPPFPFFAAIERRWGMKELESRGEAPVHLAAQDVFWESAGAYTGEVSPMMEKEFGVSYVIVGHSERRRIFGETNEVVNKKLKKALEMKLHPILCIGEAERIGDDIPETVGIELRESVRDIEPLFLESLIVAYEPIWAIGKEIADTPSNMHKAAIYIKKVLAESYGEGCANRAVILYGGSVNPDNAASFFTETDHIVGGLLVGHWSLKPAGFQRIIESVDGLVLREGAGVV